MFQQYIAEEMLFVIRVGEQGQYIAAIALDIVQNAVHLFFVFKEIEVNAVDFFDLFHR